eukprot:1160840-Pelagomonas_calceolata.AAC.6
MSSMHGKLGICDTPPYTHAQERLPLLTLVNHEKHCFDWGFQSTKFMSFSNTDTIKVSDAHAQVCMHNRVHDL